MYSNGGSNLLGATTNIQGHDLRARKVMKYDSTEQSQLVWISKWITGIIVSKYQTVRKIFLKYVV